MDSIVFWDRQLKKKSVEQVYGDFAVKLLYGNPVSTKLTGVFLANRMVSKMVGSYYSSSMSKRKIEPFIRQYDIPISDFEEKAYESFNDFFIRRFRSGKREFHSDPKALAAPCEARYLAYKTVRSDDSIPVKGILLSPRAILGSDLSQDFEGGPMLIARLCPVDYHRFHFPVDGRILTSKRSGGSFHSVNPAALAFKPDIFSENERQVTILETDFGKLAYVEVGALCVGKIVQSYSGDRFQRGDEKGYFLFGASTVLLYGQHGRWAPDSDLLEQTENHVETLVRLGEGIGKIS